MNLELTIEEIPGDLAPFPFAEKAQAVIGSVLGMLGCPYEAAISLLLTDDAAIREINLEQRDLDAATDVLSFPAIEWERAADFVSLSEAPDYYFTEENELLLGDIVLSVERAVRQADEYGHSFLREYAFLIAHSTLHLCGYDHMTDEEAAIMEELQERVLTGIGITRD